jgi:hypothetical protein
MKEIMSESKQMPASNQDGVIGIPFLESFNLPNLEWHSLESHHGRSWIASVKGFGSNFAIWIDRNSGKTISTCPDRVRKQHESIEDAKNWCFEEYKKRLLNLFN